MRCHRIYRWKILPLLAVGVALCMAGKCRGNVTLPPIFGDNMVLQQKVKMNVWGNADAGESVTVEMGPDRAQTVAGNDGTWSVKLDGLKSGGPYDMTVSGKNRIAIHNIAIGEVWVCSGESNMEFPVVAARNGGEEMAEADLPMLRVFTVEHRAAEKPDVDCKGSWVICDPESVRDFTAVGYFFARELNPGMRVPFGLIESTWGPSPLEAWVPHESLDKDPSLHETVERYEKGVEDYPGQITEYEEDLEKWTAAAAKAKGAGSPVPARPVEPRDPGEEREPSALYNGMIHPLTRYVIKGVLWYQGESNTDDPGLYGKMFPAMIEAWRAAWNEGDFPFFFAQLAGFMERRADPEESRWAELREAQAGALSLPKTGMVVTADTGEEREMHPANKQDVGHRFAVLAEKVAYGREEVVECGPVFAGMVIGDRKAVITFSHAEGGLVATSGTLRGFSIAGEDGRFYWADAQISGNKVVVSSDYVSTPVVVRYGWADFPDCDLRNQEGLPAAPFRTDGK